MYSIVFYLISYSKCPKILHTKMSDKIAYVNSVDLDQTKYFKKLLHKKQKLGQRKDGIKCLKF